MVNNRDDEARPHEGNPGDRSAIIAQLNDDFRTGEGSGRLAITQGVLALGNAEAVRVLAAVRAFDSFSSDNDPHGEHDFGAIDRDGTLIFWKIDYYDVDLRCGSPDPADVNVTTRVLTVMLADEY